MAPLPGSLLRFTDFVKQAPDAPAPTANDYLPLEVNAENRTDRISPLQIAKYGAARLFTSGATCVILATDYFVGIRKAAPSATAITLPSPVLGRQLIIADCSGNASSNPITFGPDAVDGTVGWAMSFDWQSVGLEGLGVGIGWKTVA